MCTRDKRLEMDAVSRLILSLFVGSPGTLIMEKMWLRWYSVGDHIKTQAVRIPCENTDGCYVFE